MILFLAQRKNIIFNCYTLTKKNWRNMHNILLMGNKLYQRSSPAYIFSKQQFFKFSDSFQIYKMLQGGIQFFIEVL